MSTGPEELSLETIAPEDADLIDLRYEGVDLPLDENADPTQVDLACGEHLGVVSLEGGYDDESFVDLHVLGEVFRGESAYATAVRNGFVGTEAQWLETLVGPESPNAAVALAAQLAAEQAADRAEAAETGASISETASAGHAAAASTARGQAEAYSDSAGAHAQASLDFQTQAETSAGEALAYRNQAAQSSTDADSAAARAETAEGVSVTMRNQAQGFSEASAASSQSAETYMDESRVEAQAARDAHLLAETSRENSLAHSQASYDSAQEALARSTEAGEYASAALTSRLAAEAARDDTDLAAAAVIVDRDIVIARANEAGEYAEAAESHRASALTSAGAASISADNSAISETNAESSRVAAEAARDIAVASSGDAADALAATISYRDQAEIFSDSAGDSATAAATARVAAESARDTANGAASAAATSASSASSSQTAAASSASAASTSATNAATSAGAASTSATNASNSATTASGHAATASTQATNAANSATAAGGSATAASGSASSAATSATNAGNSATSANSSSVSAASSYTATRLTAANLLPFDFSQDGAMWFNGFSGAPTAVSPIMADSVFSFPTVSGVGKVVQIATAGANRDVSGIGTIPVVSGRTYRVTGDVRALSAIVGSPTCTLYFIGMDSTGAAVTTPGTSTPTLVANTWTRVTLDYTAAALIALNSTVTQVRVLLRANGASGSNTFQFREVRLEDVTDQLAAAASASAAATSASSASTSATNAGTSASAAATSATNASTSAGSAGTSATNAANSATTATTQANNASTSASTAATHATNAGNSASAAGTSATTAGTHATNAGNSATAANTSAVNAASSYTNTVVSGGNQDFSDGLVGWSWNPDRTIPASNYSTGWLSYQASFQGRPNVIQQTTGNYCFVYSNRLWPVQAGRTYRVRSSVWIGAVAPSLTYIGIRVLDSSGAPVTGNGGHIYNVAGGVLLATNQWHDLVSSAFTTTTYAGSGITNIQLLSFLNYGVTAGASSALDGIWLEDITESVTAGNSATAAAGSASSAATSATNASNSATAANSSAVSAASSFTNANNAATNAANSATAAGTSATTAGTHATNAGNSATAASASAVSAASSFTNTVLVDGNQDFDNGFTGWYTTSGTTPVATASLGGRTNVVSLAAGVAGQWRSIKRFPVDTTRKYKVSTEVYAGAGSGSTQFYVGFAAFDANGTALVHSPGSYAYAAIIGDAWPANTGWVKRDSLLNGANAPITGEGTGTWSIFPVGTRSIELLVLQNYNNGPCVSAVNYVYWEDITETQAALSSATAAATSASSASTSAGAAGVSATSAATQATNAGVSAGNAASSASTAATQASNASASAASASSSAVTAANLSGSTANILRRSQFFTGNAVSDFAPWISGNNTLGATAGVYNYSTSWGPDGEFPLFTESPNVPGGIHDWYSDVLPAEALKYYCLSAYAGIFNASSAGDVRVFIEFMNAAGTVLGYTGAPASAFCYSSDGKQGGTSLDNFKRIFVIGQAPATTAKMRAYIRRTNMGTTSYTWVLRPMLSEASATMTAPPPFGPSNIASSVAVTQTAVASLNAQNNLARYEVVADTGGGTARLRLVSSVYGTSVKLDADKIFFGDNTVFDNAVDVLVTTTGSNSRIIAWGAAFGTDGQLTEWEGPSSITWGNHSRANAYFYRANVAPYVGGSALASGFTVTSSHTSRVGTRVGAGSVTSGTVTLTPANASGSVTYVWTRIYGDSSITATAGTSAATAFTTTVTAGQEKQAIFAWTATDGAGKVQTGTVGVGLIGNA